MDSLLDAYYEVLIYGNAPVLPRMSTFKFKKIMNEIVNPLFNYKNRLDILVACYQQNFGGNNNETN